MEILGAVLQAEGGVKFRVWAPASPTVTVEFYTAASASSAIRTFPLAAEAKGYFSGRDPDATLGSLYRYRLESGSYSDPAARALPAGPHGPAQVVDATFPWTDAAWRGRPASEMVIYELHLGTFSPTGDWAGAMELLPRLAELGITAVEIMPIAEFPGRFGWGYDGVGLFAPTRLYGSGCDAKRFIDRAHALGLMVLLDVVYNHLGPDGNFLRQFSADYFSRECRSEWGDALNFGGPNSAPVRDFFLRNVRYWIEEFHCDGLRLDATQQIFDRSPVHILAEISRVVRESAPGRLTFLVGENETQQCSLVRPRSVGGCELDALWNDDYHHSAHVAATGRREAYYLDYRGTAQELVSAVTQGFLFQGQWCRWQGKRRGTPTRGLKPTQFVLFLQNHDQVANSLRGQRLHELTSPGKWRALTALTLLAPATPLIFQGQEFAASAPFTYFADHHGDLAKLVGAGRRKFLEQFPSVAAAWVKDEPPAPEDPAAFERCRLDWSEWDRHSAARQLHQDLLRLRRDEPGLQAPAPWCGAVLTEQAFVLRYGSPAGDRLLLVNLGPGLLWDPAPEPLLAPLPGQGWRIRWSSEALEYGGGGTPVPETQSNWVLPAESALLLEPYESSALPPARLSERSESSP